MRSWEAAPPALGNAHDVVLELISQIGSEAFGTTMLTHINHQLPAGSLSLYRTWSDQPPKLLMARSIDSTDPTLRCFAAYQNRLYLEDHSFDAVRARREQATCMLLHIRADEFKSPAHRELVYNRNHVRERLSVARGDPDGSVLSLNIYAHEGHTSYTDRHLGHFESLAPLLFAGVQRHLDLLPKPHENPAPLSDSDLNRRFLLAMNAELTAREIDVCDGLLQGLTYDGIAQSLALSRATVITYRNRAFARLGINFKNQLFAQRANFRTDS